MKIKATKQEIRECVQGAVLRIVKEGKSLHGFDRNGNDFHKEKPNKHGKLTQQREKGNRGNRNWEDYAEED